MGKTKLSWRQTIQTLSKWDSASIGRLVRSGQYTVAENIECDVSELPQLAHGWRLQLTKAYSHKHRTLYIAPTIYETGCSFATGQKQRALNAGLTLRQSVRFAKSKHIRKHALLPHLAELAKNTQYADANRAFNYEGTVEDYCAWVADYGISDGLTPQRRVELIQLWSEIIPTQQLKALP